MLVLHVGPHKTATTWLQSNFHHNAKALEKAGWYYPQTGERVRIAHHDLSDNPAEILDGDSRKVKELKRIAERAKAGNLDILLSSEGFRHWTAPQLKRLQKIMAPHEIHIVYCLRDPVSLLYSFWAQQVKGGSFKSLPEFYRIQRKRGLKSRVFNPFREIRKFDTFAQGRMTVLLYDQIRRSGRDIFDVFVEDILKIGSLPKTELQQANERQPIELTEFMRLVLKSLGRRENRGQVSMGRLFQHMLTDAKRDEIIAAVAATRPKADRHLLIERNQPFLRKLERKLVADYSRLMHPPASADGLFAKTPEDLVHLDDKILEQDHDVMRLCRSLAGRFRPGGIHMFVANASRFWLIRWRRMVKMLR